MSKAWAGGSTRQWRKLRASILADNLARNAGRCRLQITDVCTGQANTVHHTRGRNVTGDDPRFLIATCTECNLHVGEPEPDAVFPAEGATPDTRALSFLSPRAALAGPEDVRDGLAWDSEALAEFAWLRPLLAVPGNAAPPLWMSRPPADAVGSYGPEAIEWIEETQALTLRWWQKLAITRQLEHREDGSLCHSVVLESAPRRAGKSVRVRGTVLWRMAHPELFGEVQTVIHTGSDVAICREIQRGAWRWAEDVVGWKVTRANGKEALESLEGDRWLVRAQNAVYGYDVCMGVVDEAWDVKPDTVNEGLEPATLERSSPQIHLTSTAHRRATSLMRNRIQAALTSEDPEVLLMVWAAAPGSDPADPETWRAASPYWSEARRKLIAGKYELALAGEVDPQADDPDPMAGFEAQYLNVWRLAAAPVERGNPVVSEEEWAALSVGRPQGTPDSVAIEAGFQEGVSLAMAWRVNDVIAVSVQDLPDLEAAAASLRALGVRKAATVGASLVDDPALAGLRIVPGKGRAGQAVQDLGRLMSEGTLAHDGGELLTRQVLAARIAPSADGPRMVSTGRADGIKAVVWAAEACQRKPVGKVRIILPD